MAKKKTVKPNLKIAILPGVRVMSALRHGLVEVDSVVGATPIATPTACLNKFHLEYATTLIESRGGLVHRGMRIRKARLGLPDEFIGVVVSTQETPKGKCDSDYAVVIVALRKVADGPEPKSPLELALSAPEAANVLLQLA